MRHNDWKDYNRRQTQRRVLLHQTTPHLYAPRQAPKSDDAIEAEIEAMKANADILAAVESITITTAQTAAANPDIRQSLTTKLDEQTEEVFRKDA